MIKLSDYVVQFLVDHGVREIFLVSGGGIMHLLDSVGRNPHISYYCNYHEQASVIGAEAVARVTGRIGACMATAGPGAANALSGVVASWVDSVPLIVISGQVRSDLIADYTKIRQLGPQEANVLGMAHPITKYATSVRDPLAIRYHLERAFYEATSGRPGPVWIEIPVDIQAININEADLAGFAGPRVDTPANLAKEASAVLEAIRNAKRPVIVPGNGIHYSHSRELLRELLERTNVPVLLPLTAKDLIEEEHPLQMGVFGGTGQRRANFAIQNSDCLIALAAGLNVQKIGFNVAGFAPKARQIVIDIDRGQLCHAILRPDVAIQADIHALLTEMLSQLNGSTIAPKDRWLDACRRWKQRYPVMVPDYYSDPHHVNTYVFMDKLADFLAPGDVLITGNGTDVVSYYQAFRVKKGQRTLNTGWGSMGWDLPLAVGASIARPDHRTVCVTGDGSLQCNVQELLTVAHYRIPIKLFVLNNHGYTCIRTTQKNFFEGRFVGADSTSGVGNPEYSSLAAAYRWKYANVVGPDALARTIDHVLRQDGPVLCEVNVAIDQGISPKASAFVRGDGTFESRPLEDMAPFLAREEVWENMHLFETEE